MSAKPLPYSVSSIANDFRLLGVHVDWVDTMPEGSMVSLAQFLETRTWQLSLLRGADPSYLRMCMAAAWEALLHADQVTWLVHVPVESPDARFPVPMQRFQRWAPASDPAP